MYSFRLFLVRLCLLLASSAITSAPAANAVSVTTRQRIVILGDSITAGYGLSRDDAYPALLQRKVDAAHLPYEVVNAGLSGDTTAGGLRRVDWALSAGAKVLVVALGGNDGLRGLPPQQTAANLAAIIKRAREKIPGLTVLVAGMQMPASMGVDFAKAFGALFPQVAAESGAVLIPYLLKDVGGVPSLNQPDYIHPTAEGQKIVAENVWAVLKQVLN
jgi:acyl-CoA thioesterase I